MTRRRHWILLAACGLAVAVGSLTAGLSASAAVPVLVPAVVPAATPVPAVPLLRITMTDRISAPQVGDVLAYGITVADRDHVALPMEVRLVAPTGLGDIRVTDGGTLVGRQLTWPVSLHPGEQVTVHFTASVGGHATRVATTACAYLDGGVRPTACASDLDNVGVAAAGDHWVPIAGGAVFVVLLAGGAYAVRRRRSKRPRVAVPGQPSGALDGQARGAELDEDTARV
jgi:hypothetical protein